MTRCRFETGASKSQPERYQAGSIPAQAITDTDTNQLNETRPTMDSQEIINHVFNVMEENASPASLSILSIQAAKETIQELVREDEHSAEFFECATCGCLITNEMAHEHKDGWFGS
jgi:hypothetical protein